MPPGHLAASSTMRMSDSHITEKSSRQPKPSVQRGRRNCRQRLLAGSTAYIASGAVRERPPRASRPERRRDHRGRAAVRRRRPAPCHQSAASPGSQPPYSWPLLAGSSSIRAGGNTSGMRKAISILTMSQSPSCGPGRSSWRAISPSYSILASG